MCKAYYSIMWNKQLQYKLRCFGYKCHKPTLKPSNNKNFFFPHNQSSKSGSLCCSLIRALSDVYYQRLHYFYFSTVHSWECLFLWADGKRPVWVLHNNKSLPGALSFCSNVSWFSFTNANGPVIVTWHFSVSPSVSDDLL